MSKVADPASSPSHQVQVAKPWQILEGEDPEVFGWIEKELHRQKTGLEMIASENFASPAVVACMGNILTNKYAEGLPYKRYYGGCENVDGLEDLTIERAKKLFQVGLPTSSPTRELRPMRRCFWLC